MYNSFELLTPEQQELRLMVRDFADREIIPAAKELEINSEFPTELYRKAFEMGLTTATLPEKYGGMGLDIFTYSLSSGGADRENGSAQNLHRLRYIRSNSAYGRHERIRYHYRDQSG